MHKSEIMAVFLAAILFTGALTAAIPSFMVDAEASNDNRYTNYKDVDVDVDADDSEASSDKKDVDADDSEASSDKKDVDADDSEASSDKKDVDADDSEASNDNRYINYKDVDVNTDDSEASSEKGNIKNRDVDKNSSNNYNQDNEQISYQYQDKYPKENGYYDGSDSYGQVYTKPSYGSEYGNDYDKKIIKKIIVVCPNGVKVPVDRDNSVMTGNVHGGEENRFIDNIVESACPAIDSCEECFKWLLNFADNRTESVAVVNTVINALNEQTPTTASDLETIDVGSDGYEGPNLWEICKFFNGLLENSTSHATQGQIILALINSIENAVKAGEETPIVGSLAINIIECIDELEGIDTNASSEQNSTVELPLLTTNAGTIR